MDLARLMGRYGLSVGLGPAGGRPGSMVAWLNWSQVPDILLMFERENVDVTVEHRLSARLTYKDDTVLVLVEPDETEYRHAGAQAILDYDDSIGQRWPTPKGYVTTVGVQAMSRYDKSDDALHQQMSAIIEAATRRMQHGPFVTPMAPVSARAETLAVLLSDAIDGWGVDWAMHLTHLHRNPDLVQTARLLASKPRTLHVGPPDAPGRHI